MATGNDTAPAITPGPNALGGTGNITFYGGDLYYQYCDVSARTSCMARAALSALTANTGTHASKAHFLRYLCWLPVM
jgi:hypothetical protein